jgi:hypothetical protein
MKMKTYKTWQAIKMLSENPKLVFKSNSGLYKPITLELDKGGFIEISYLDLRSSIKSDFEWILVQQPVSFIEAVEAYSKGKTIYCEFNSRKYIYEPDVIKKCIVAEEGYVVEDDTESSISTGEILQGKWFIEEGEE